MDELAERRELRRTEWWNGTGRQLVFNSIARPLELAVMQIAECTGRDEAEVRTEVVRIRAVARPTCGGSRYGKASLKEPR